MDNNLEHYQQRIAYLESVNDQLATEIAYVDDLLRLVGFPQGLETVKEAAKELIEEMEQEHEGERDLLY